MGVIVERPRVHRDSHPVSLARAMRTHAREHHWGRIEWEGESNLRTFIEGWGGVVKNLTVAGMGLAPRMHPLTLPDEDDHGVERLDAGRAAHIDRPHDLQQMIDELHDAT